MELWQQLAQGMVASLRELNAYLRDVRDRGSEGLHAYYAEVRRMIKALDQNAVVGFRALSVPITTNVVSGGSGATATWKVPVDGDFAVAEARGFIASNDWTSEVVLPGLVLGDATTSLWPRERVFMKAQNAKVTLKNQDTAILITDNTLSDVVLSSITPECGGMPFEWGGKNRPSLVLPHDTTVAVKVTLSKVATYLTAGNTDYGMILTGMLMSRIVGSGR